MTSLFSVQLADVISLEFIVISGGVLLLLVAGVFFAIAMFVAGIIKRRKAKQELESTRHEDRL